MAITTQPGASATDLTTLKGTDGADVFAPTTVESNLIVVSALKGNDTITFANTVTESEVFGGRDSDTITVSKSLESSSISGDKGVDLITITEETFTSTIDGGDSVDTLTFTGAVSDSSIFGGNGNDTITLSSLTTRTLVNGNADEDTFSITGTLKASTVHGGKGNDVFSAASVTDSSLLGDKGNDDYTITAVVTNASIDGGVGNDTIELTAAATNENSSILGGEGDDSVDWKGTTGDGIYIDGGSDEDDLESAGNLKDTILGGLGKDTITVADGAALIWGGSSEFDDKDTADTITAGNGAVTIYAAEGADVISTGTGKAVIIAGLGADDVTVGAGDVSVNGGKGNDTVTMDDASLTKADTISGDDGTDVLELTTLGADVADADFTGIGSFETLEFTGAGAGVATVTLDTKFVSSGISTVTDETTGTNAITIDASAVTSALTINGTDADSDDTLKGGTAADTISTGANGLVKMSGGKGIDQFVAKSAHAGVSITDFGTNSETDTFNLTSTSGTVGIAVLSDFTATASHVNNSGGAVTLTTDGAGIDLNLSNSGGTKGFTVATGSNDGATKNTIIGSKFIDSITATAAGSTITGGKEADALVGAAGVDTFNQSTGDTPAASATNLASDDLSAGCTITFGNGIDILTTFTSGTDTLNLAAASATALQATADIDGLTIGANYLVRGTIVPATGVITQSDTGNDYLVFTAAATNLNGTASAFGTNAIISDGAAIATTDIV